MTAFNVTYDSLRKSIVLIAGEKIVEGIDGISIQRGANGEYTCEVTRASTGGPQHLVATHSHTGKSALSWANGRTGGQGPSRDDSPSPTQNATQDLAALFGFKADAEHPTEIVEPPKQVAMLTAEGIGALFGYVPEPK